jgi:orotidine-5'-phosphate decarboxylase
MAQNSKSRIMIWSVVVVLVVVAVVMLVTKPKDMGKPINPDQLARSYTRSFERLEKRVAKAQSEFPGAPAEQWQKINEEIALGRQVLAGVPGVTEQKDLVTKRESLQHAYIAGNKILKAITGSQDQDEPEGGE